MPKPPAPRTDRRLYLPSRNPAGRASRCSPAIMSRSSKGCSKLRIFCEDRQSSRCDDRGRHRRSFLGTVVRIIAGRGLHSLPFFVAQRARSHDLAEGAKFEAGTDNDLSRVGQHLNSSHLGDDRSGVLPAFIVGNFIASVVVDDEPPVWFSISVG